jgi:hypothetical protein
MACFRQLRGDEYNFDVIAIRGTACSFTKFGQEKPDA